MARESHYQRQGMAKWIEESRNADPKKKAAVLGKEMSLTAMRNGLIIKVCEDVNATQRFLSCAFPCFFGGHICKIHRTCFDEELELFWLLKSEPYLLKLGRDRLS